MSADGRLAAMTQQWALPKTAVAATSVGELATHATSHTQADAFAYRDGPAPARGSNAYGAALLSAGLSSSTQGGGFIKVDASTAGAPSFVSAQVAHGKKLYAGACAKCHGANLEGLNAPALKGPAFAPVSNSHLTIGGVFNYMFTNMPADNPGKLKPQDYADLMAFLLNSNGYAAGATKLTADAAKASATPLNAGSAVTLGASQ
jgi:mono/diheme cytochrome c family protein